MITKIKKREESLVKLGEWLYFQVWNTDSSHAARQTDQKCGQGVYMQSWMFHMAITKELTSSLHPLNSCQINHKVKSKVIYDNKMAEIHPAA